MGLGDRTADRQTQAGRVFPSGKERVEHALRARRVKSGSGVAHGDLHLSSAGPARHCLLIPDLLAYWLTGVAGAERTNASTTQLYDARRGEWARELIERAGIPWSLFPPLRSPGDVIGPVQPGVGEHARQLGGCR